MDNAYIYARPDAHTRGRAGAFYGSQRGAGRVRRDDGYYGCQGGMDDRAD